GSRWIDERLVLAINTYGSSQQLLHVYSDGLTSHASLGFKSVPQAGVWTHLAVTFDHHTITLYRDGVAVGGGPRGVNTVTEGVPMWIGRCLGLGMPYFHGLLDEARVYDRALSEVEVLGLFKRDAGGRGKDTRWFTQPKIDATIIAGAGKVYLKIDARAMRPLPPNARVVVKAGELSKTIELTDDGVAKWFVDFQAQAPGNYTVTAQVAGRGKTTRVKVNWPGQPAAFAHIKVLNNLVWEMLDEKNVGEGEYLIELPCDRWVFVQSDATTPPGGRRQIHIDDQRVIDHGAEGRQTLETMRFLRAGDHAVRITATGDGDIHQLIVRAIPMLQHANYNSNPIIKPHGPFDWDFVTRYLMRDVNTMVSRSGGVDE
ncbi:MAG: LamG domain-containing protein, partial [Phycisphaeraceae bacterium]|nr:LamG domain-containing protein [Phycisphaeraceae bacterium]